MGNTSCRSLPCVGGHVQDTESVSEPLARLLDRWLERHCRTCIDVQVERIGADAGEFVDLDRCYVFDALEDVGDATSDVAAGAPRDAN